MKLTNRSTFAEAAGGQLLAQVLFKRQCHLNPKAPVAEEESAKPLSAAVRSYPPEAALHT
jgi:hypothetical protein